jgi:hypothetical protein
MTTLGKAPYIQRKDLIISKKDIVRKQTIAYLWSGLSLLKGSRISFPQLVNGNLFDGQS